MNFIKISNSQIPLRFFLLEIDFFQGDNASYVVSN